MGSRRQWMTCMSPKPTSLFCLHPPPSTTSTTSSTLLPFYPSRGSIHTSTTGSMLLLFSVGFLFSQYSACLSLHITVSRRRLHYLHYPLAAGGAQRVQDG